MMRKKHIGMNVRVLVAAFFLLLVGGCEKKTIPLPDHPGGQIFHGIKRSDVRCYRCHGPLGAGGPNAPPLVNNGKTIAHDQFVQMVLNGRGQMPPFQSVLTEDEILSIADWLEKVSVLGTGTAGDGPEKGSK